MRVNGQRLQDRLLGRSFANSSVNTMPKLAAAITIVLAIVALVGWLLSVPILRSVIPGAVEMKANTAASLLLSAIALFILCDRPSLLGQRSAQALALLVSLVGLATLAEYLFGWRLSIDELLFRDNSDAYNVIRGRMSPFSAVVFVLLGLSLAALPRYRLRYPVRKMAALIMVIGGFAVIGYL